jgi:DNA ligase D-like protein (predicted ligase)/DNA ligase D-like protein (predicted 3'-phosphoesterase)
MKPSYKPMLAQPAKAAFSSRDWIFEVKWDGIRAISYVTADFSIKSRNNKELRQNFPELEELKDLTENTVLDGEIITIKEGNADFQTVIERSKATSAYEIRYLAQKFPATYVVFDIIEKDGKPLINLPLIERKRILKESLKEGKNVVLSVFVEEEGEAYYEAALEKGSEGIVAKKKTSLYEPGIRSGNWLKIKKIKSCDCAIFGYTKGEGKRQETFGALILGLYDRERPVYVGKVGTGFSEDEMQRLLARFKTLETQEKTLEGVEIPEEIVWLKPLLVCEVAYQTVTNDGKLRMPRFRGLRIDKRPEECTINQIKQSNLEEYVSRRDFRVTPEPLDTKTQAEGRVFVVQEHHARRLHYDLRLEREGVLRSWAVPKGIPTQSGEKRLAVQTEDHPLEYRKFEGTIPPGQYGAGTVKIWDKGSYQLKVWAEDKIEFTLNGDRLHGKYVLAKFKKAGEKDWLLLKTRD